MTTPSRSASAEGMNFSGVGELVGHAESATTTAIRTAIQDRKGSSDAILKELRALALEKKSTGLTKVQKRKVKHLRGQLKQNRRMIGTLKRREVRVHKAARKGDIRTLQQVAGQIQDFVYADRATPEFMASNHAMQCALGSLHNRVQEVVKDLKKNTVVAQADLTEAKNSRKVHKRPVRKVKRLQRKANVHQAFLEGKSANAGRQQGLFTSFKEMRATARSVQRTRQSADKIVEAARKDEQATKFYNNVGAFRVALHKDSCTLTGEAFATKESALKNRMEEVRLEYGQATEDWLTARTRGRQLERMKERGEITPKACKQQQASLKKVEKELKRKQGRLAKEMKSLPGQIRRCEKARKQMEKELRDLEKRTPKEASDVGTAKKQYKRLTNWVIQREAAVEKLRKKELSPEENETLDDWIYERQGSAADAHTQELLDLVNDDMELD